MQQLNSDLSVTLPYNVGETPVYLMVDEMYRHGYFGQAHWHADWEFFAPIAGDMLLYVNGRTYTVAEGSGMLVNSGRLHYPSAQQRRDCTFIDLALNPDVLTQLLGSQTTAIREKISVSAPDVLALTPEVPWQATILDRLHLLGNAYRFGGSDPLTVAVEALAICTRVLSRLHVDHVQVAAVLPGQQRVWQMVDYVQQHYATHLTAELIAASVHISRNQCFTLFQTVLGMGPGAYVQQVRLAQAMKLLRTTQQSVAEIAQACGYRNVSHFVAVFKREVGETPRKYRLAQI